jgi:transposase
MEKSITHYTSEEKVDILRQLLVDHIPLLELCAKYQIAAARLYKWQRELFQNGAAVFETKRLRLT